MKDDTTKKTKNFTPEQEEFLKRVNLCTDARGIVLTPKIGLYCGLGKQLRELGLEYKPT